jgi:SdrD B-like domain
MNPLFAFGPKSSARSSRRRLAIEALDDRITPSCGCELPPSQISGLVYFDQNKDGFAQDTEPRLQDVTVTLKGRTEDGDKVKLTTTTDAGGIFMFQGLDAGTYKLRVSTPKGYSPGDSSVGAFGGNPHHNTITKIEITGGQSSGAYNFGQVVHSKQSDNDHGSPKGNNGVGNGLDSQPPGNPPVNDGEGTSPGTPGHQTGPVT